MAAFFNLMNRFNDSLGVEIEPRDEVELIRNSVRLESKILRDYVRDVLAENR